MLSPDMRTCVDIYMYYRVAQKKPGTGYFPLYVGEITDAKISNFGSVVCFLGHIL